MPRPYFESKDKKIQEILRVNHAGEYGAQRIYQGQIAHTRNIKTKSLIRHMLDQELEHLEYFDNKIKDGLARPSFLMPIWNLCGYSLGTLSAMIGDKTTMLVTENVEEVIVKHYQDQIDYLENRGTKEDNLLLQKIKKFKQDEANHIHIAVDNESKNVYLHNLLSKMVQNMCKVAIFLSKKI